MKVLAILLASWLALGTTTVVPKDDGAAELPPPPSEDLLQKVINPLEDLPFEIPLQEEVDLFNPVFQREVFDLPLPGQGEPHFSPRGRRPPGAGRPRWPINLAEFPPGRPTLSNIDSICTEGRQKASYGPWNLPHTGFSHLRRQGEALNDLEVTLSQCCHLPENEKLECTQTAWSDTLETFCNSEFSVKTRPYPCCKLEGATKENCFAKKAPYPNYNYSTSKPGDKTPGCTPSDSFPCKPQDLVGVHKLPAISFPPGRPNKANIKNICKLRKFRPVYPAGTFPQTGFGWFVRQARAISRLENEYKKCCRKEDVSCAHRGWEKILTQFCKQEGAVKTKPYMCCKEPEGEDRFNCFSNLAPHPAYDREIQVVNLAEVTPSLLDLLCGQITLLAKQKHVPALVQNMTTPCCTLQGDERTQCAQQEKSQFISTLCNSPKNFWKDSKKCCSHGEDAARLDCFDSGYLSNVTLASPSQPLQPTVPTE